MPAGAWASSVVVPVQGYVIDPLPMVCRGAIQLSFCFTHVAPATSQPLFFPAADRATTTHQAGKPREGQSW